MMQRTVINAATTWGDIEHEAWTTRTPGLVVCPPHPDDEGHPGMWVVTHVRSGAVVAYEAGPEQAMAAAEELGTWRSWEVSGDELRSDIVTALQVLDRWPQRGEPMDFGDPRLST